MTKKKTEIMTAPNQHLITSETKDLNFPVLAAVRVDGDTYDQMRETLRIIGRAIKAGSRYLPIRNRAAALASTAKPKDYKGQMAAIYNDFVKRWRYVKDPLDRELVTQSPKQIFELVMGGRSNSPGVGLGRGAGDCDDAAVAMGAQLMSIGIPVRIATIAPVGAPPGRLMSHVFVQGLINNIGWITCDPVVYPIHGFGYTPQYSRIAFWDLDGRLINSKGNAIDLKGLGGWEDRSNQMITMPNINKWADYAGLGDYSEGDDIVDFRLAGIKDWGLSCDYKGMIDLGDVALNLAAEVDTDERGFAWTPALEIADRDYDFIKATGAPYHGMLALSDDLDQYYWDQNLGFFKKLFRKIKKGVKKVARGIKKGVKRVGKKFAKVAKKVIKKLPGGKYLLKLGSKIWKMSKKLVRPLTKFVGKYAKKLAPVAALIPGYGPAIAGALHMSGRIAKLLKKHGVKVVGKKSDPVAKLKFKNPKSAALLKKDLKVEAEKVKKRKVARSARPVRSKLAVSARPVRRATNLYARPMARSRKMAIRAIHAN